jgi:protein-tyrosine-phosphatase
MLLSGYVRALLELSKRDDILTVMPFTEVDAYILCTHKQVLENRLRTVWVSGDTFESVRDRVKLLKIARDVGVPVPKTRIMSQWDDWSSPCVIKSRYSIMEANGRAFYGGVRFVEPNRPPDYRSVVGEMMHEPMVQEYIQGPEYGFFALFNNGQLRAKFQHKRLLSMIYTGGGSALRKSVYLKELDELGIKLLKALNWHGPAMVEFKFDSRDKKFKLMEINPRFWGSLSLAIDSGVDFPYLYYQIAANGDCESVLEYKTNVMSHYIAGELVYLMSLVNTGPRYIVKPNLFEAILLITKHLRGSSKFDTLDRHDIAPFMVDLCSKNGKRLQTPVRMACKARDLLFDTCVLVEEHLSGPRPFQVESNQPTVRILFVCYGNVCRSPMAEGIFRSLLAQNNLLDDVYVDSAGTSILNVGRRPYWRARQCLRKRGINISNHRARQFTRNDFDMFNRIMVMDQFNLSEVLRKAGGNEDKEKVFLLLKYAAHTSVKEVPDPYTDFYPFSNGHRSFDEVCDLIEDGCIGLFADMKAELKHTRNSATKNHVCYARKNIVTRT